MVFDRAGYNAATLNEVATLANTMAQAERGATVTKGAVSHHFQSKKDLAEAVITAQHTWSVGLAKQKLEDDEPGLRSAIEMSLGLAAKLSDHEKPLVRAGIKLTLENGPSFDLPVDPYREWIDATVELLRRAVTEGDVRVEVDVAAAAELMVGCFVGVHLLSEVLSGRARLDEQVRLMWTFWLEHLVPEERVAEFRGFVAGRLMAEMVTP